MRTTLDVAAAGVHGRVSALRVDTAVEGVGVDAVVLVPTHAAGLEARLQRTLGERLGRPVAVRVREVLTADDATVARQQGTLAELKRSVLALQDAEKAIRYRPKISQSYIVKGKILDSEGNTSEALEAYRRAKGADPKVVIPARYQQLLDQGD